MSQLTLKASDGQDPAVCVGACSAETRNASKPIYQVGIRIPFSALLLYKELLPLPPLLALFFFASSAIALFQGL